MPPCTYWIPALIIGRGVVLIAAALVIATVIGWRLAFEWFVSRVAPRERLLIVGTSPGAVALARELHAMRGQIGVELVGFVDVDPARVGQPVFNPGVIGTVEDIPAVVRARGVDRVVVSLSDARGSLPMDKLLEMKIEGVSFAHLASVYEEYTGKIAVENLRPSWFIFSDGFRQSAWLAMAKRVSDLVLAAVALVLAAPVMALVALAVRLTSKGPVLYHQQSRRPARPRLHRAQVPVDAITTPRPPRARCGVKARPIPASRSWATCCDGRASTNCRSCGTS